MISIFLIVSLLGYPPFRPHSNYQLPDFIVNHDMQGPGERDKPPDKSARKLIEFINISIQNFSSGAPNLELKNDARPYK